MSMTGAVKQTESVATLGHLTWYTISECQIPREQLKANLQKSGLGESYMPGEIRPADAFRRATSDCEKRRIPDPHKKKVFQNYLVREVNSDSDEIVRKVVKETVDSAGKRLSYNNSEATIRLEKGMGNIESQVESPDEVVASIVAEIKDLFNDYKTHHNSRAIRGIVGKIIKTMNPTTVRPSGGVYFIPQKHEETLTRLVGFIKSLGGQSEGFMLPIIDEESSRDMIRQKIHDDISNTAETLARGIKRVKEKKASKTHINLALEEGKRVLSSHKEMKQTLESELEEMTDKVSLLRKQMLTLVEVSTE